MPDNDATHYNTQQHTKMCFMPDNDVAGTTKSASHASVNWKDATSWTFRKEMLFSQVGSFFSQVGFIYLFHRWGFFVFSGGVFLDFPKGNAVLTGGVLLCFCVRVSLCEGGRACV